MENEDRIEETDLQHIIDGIELADDEDDEMPEGLDEDQIEGIVRTAVMDAVDFIEMEISPDREKAQRYADGKVDIGHEDGRSKLVATKVRDTIRAVKPSLMRVFLTSSKFVEYIPQGPEDVQAAEDATEAMHIQFNKLGGFSILRDAFHDALVKKTGVVKAYYDDYEAPKVYSFTGLSQEQMMALALDPEVEIMEMAQVVTEDVMQVDGVEAVQQAMPTFDVRLMHKKRAGKLCVENVPPEEFFIDRNARSIDDCYVCGHRRDMRVADLVAMGVEYDDAIELGSSTDTTSQSALEDQARRGYTTDPDEDQNALDKTMKNVMVTEAYMRMDIDGTGTAPLYRFLLGGNNYKMLQYEPCDEIPFAVFEIDPEPHTVFGRSLADIVMEDQDAATAILRGVLDNVAMVNNPRVAAVRSQVNLDDLMNNEIGAIVRMEQQGAVQPLAVPFVAGQTLPALQYVDQAVEVKTGVSRASMGLNPDALQSTTREAVTATVSAAAGQVEVMARNLAETGGKRLFKLMLSLLNKHADILQFMSPSLGRFVQMDPRVWNTEMDVQVNIGLGTGRDEERQMMLMQTLQLQKEVYQGYGPSNGIVTLSHIRNTISDMLAIGGLYNSNRYFAPMNPQMEQQLMMQQAQAAQQQAQQGGSDPNAAFLQAEQMKVMQKAQADMQKGQLDAAKLQMDDDRQRDKMLQDMMLKSAELRMKYGQGAPEQQILAGQMAPRQ